MNLISIGLDDLDGSDLHSDGSSLPAIKQSLEQEIAVREIERGVCPGTPVRAIAESLLHRVLELLLFFLHLCQSEAHPRAKQGGHPKVRRVEHFRIKRQKRSHASLKKRGVVWRALP